MIMSVSIYRIEHPNKGLWYDPDGTFTNFIVDKVVGAKSRDLPMGWDPNMLLGVKAWISATIDKNELPNWVSPSDGVAAIVLCLIVVLAL
jgi:hypothetical protein